MRVLRISSVLRRSFMYISVGAVASVFGGMVIYVLAMGIPHINAELFEPVYNSENCSLIPALLNTLVITVLALAIAVPTGIFAAVYLVEYAPRGNRFVALVRLTAETLAGIPSIVYGLFGSLMFVKFFGLGYSLLGGSLTLSIMILPVIMCTTEEALMSVPDMYREGSFGLGAGKLRTVFRVVLPAAVPGIMAGIVLSTGRIVGETAALIFTAGTAAEPPTGLLNPGRTLSVHLYALWSEGHGTGKAYATAVVLLLIVILLNAASAAIQKRMIRRQG